MGEMVLPLHMPYSTNGADIVIPPGFLTSPSSLPVGAMMAPPDYETATKSNAPPDYEAACRQAEELKSPATPSFLPSQEPPISAPVVNAPPATAESVSRVNVEVVDPNSPAPGHQM